MANYELTDDAMLRRYIKRLGMTLSVDLHEHPGHTVVVCYQATDATGVVLGESRAIGGIDAPHLALALRAVRRDLADAARALVVGGKEALNAKQD